MATQKRINAVISLQAHKVIEKVKTNMDFISKEEALNYIIIEYEKLNG